MSATKTAVPVIDPSCSPGGGSCFAPADAVISTLEDNRPGRLLDRAERLILGLRLTLALAALCLVAVAGAIYFFLPASRGVADLVAGAGAALVAIPVFIEAWESLKDPSLDGISERLIGLALIAAWATGDLMTAAFLPIIMTIGHVLEERNMLGSGEAISALTRLTEVDVLRLKPGGGSEVVSGKNLKVGDIIELRAGERVPADGIIRQGSSNLDIASLTGESVPVEVGEGNEAPAGAMNLDGRLLLEVTRTGEESTVGRIIALMREAEASKPPLTRMLDKYANQYMMLVILVAGATWLISGSTPAMLAVLVASCPCALALAAPATAVAAIAVAARHGILIKGSGFLEHLAEVSSVIFDKTGTLTTGDLHLAGVEAVEGVDPAVLKQLGASLGAASNHPLSRAAAAAVPKAGRLEIEDAREMGGFGVTGQYKGEVVAMGRADWFGRLGVMVSALPAHVGPIAGVSRNGKFMGWLLFYDQLRSSASAAVQDLKGLGVEHMVLLTGDRTAVAKQVAAEIGVNEVWAEMLPEQKLERVLHEIKNGHKPMVVGDGINDSLALRAGAVGVAMGTHGSDIALASADLALMTNDLRRLGTCIRLSRRCRSTISVNIVMGLAFTFGLVALAGFNVLGHAAPIIAAILHNVSTFLGLGNSGRLLLFDETGAAGAAAVPPTPATA